MPKGNRKQRHEAKRKAKRRELRRIKLTSPLKRLAETPGQLQCFMSTDFEERGQTQIFVHKQAGGLSGLACFLVDRGVVGLKDAWAKVGISLAEFKRILERCKDSDIDMRRVDLEVAKKMIAGGLRWAHDNGMRQPKDWVRTASLIEGVGDWMHAEVSLFAKEFAGHPDDLRQRLISEPLESYLKRPDVTFVFNTSAPYMDQETGEYSNAVEFSKADEDSDSLDDGALAEITGDDVLELSERLSDEECNWIGDKYEFATMQLARETLDWLAEEKQEPSTELISAWRAVLMARSFARVRLPSGTEEAQSVSRATFLARYEQHLPEDRVAEHRRAVEQVQAHLKADPETAKLQRLLEADSSGQDDPE